MGFDFFTHPLQTNEFHYAKVLWENEKMWNKQWKAKKMGNGFLCIDWKFKSSKALKDQREKEKKMTWKRNIKSTHKEDVRIEVANSSNAPLSKAQERRVNEENPFYRSLRRNHKNDK